MCGISGYSGQFNPDLLDRMTVSMKHRGPDDQGRYILNEAGIGLAHVRLSIIDLSVDGHQPMIDELTGNVIVYNGEIYNYQSLRSSLIAKGVQFKTQTDTEVVLKLYQHEGCDLLNKLKGMFSFAIFDRQKKSLFIARDQFGVKPFYYALTPKGFIFASEIKSILQEASVSRALNPQAVDAYIRYLWSPAPHTMLKAVKKLEPGHAMLIQDGIIKKAWSYYTLPIGTGSHMQTEKEASENLVSLLSKSVSEQMIADVPVGAFLSGGLDSSALVALAKSQFPDLDLPCFTMRFNDPSQEQVADLPYAKLAAKYLNVSLNIIDVKPEMLQNLGAMIYALDEPQADPAAINTYLISSLAHERGIKVLLSGAGGDDLFTGYRRHYALQASKYLYALPQSVKLGISKMTAKLPQNYAMLRRLSKGLRYLNYSAHEYITSYFYWLDPKIQTNMYGELMLQHSYEDSLSASLNTVPAKTSALNKMLYLEMKHFLCDHNLNYTDKMAMATSVEVRVPFLETSLVEFAAKLPLHFKQRGREGKWLLKKAMQPYLPNRIIYRAKSGFGVPLRHWLRHDLRPMMLALLSEPSINARGLFNAKAVAQLIKLNQMHPIDASYSLLAMMNIELWCQTFIDDDVPQVRSFI